MPENTEEELNTAALPQGEETAPTTAEAAFSAQSDAHDGELSSAQTLRLDNELTAAQIPVQLDNELSAAQAPVPFDNKKKLAEIIKFAAITVFGIYIVQFFHFFELLFQPVYRGNLSTVVYCIITVACWIPFIFFLHKFAKKKLGYKLFNRKNAPVPFKRACIIYACVLVPIVIVSICLGFELKVVYELGSYVNQLVIIRNATLYAQGSVELILAVIFMELVQEAMELVYHGKYAEYIPWGGIGLALVYGSAEVLVAYLTGANVLFAWLNIPFFVLYGVIYLLSKKNFSVTLFAAIIIYIL